MEMKNHQKKSQFLGGNLEKEKCPSLYFAKIKRQTFFIFQISSQKLRFFYGSIFFNNLNFQPIPKLQEFFSPISLEIPQAILIFPELWRSKVLGKIFILTTFIIFWIFLSQNPKKGRILPNKFYAHMFSQNDSEINNCLQYEQKSFRFMFICMFE